MGISDVPLAKQRHGGGRGGGNGEGVFEAEKLRALLIGLVCTADPAQHAPKQGPERALFSDFEYMEGYPHVRTTCAAGI